MRFPVFISTLLGLSLCWTPAHAIDKALTYSLYAGGIHALDATVSLTETKARYDIELKAGTAPAFKLAAPWSGTFATTGWLKDGKRQPERYKVYSKLSEKVKAKETAYKSKGGLASFKATENGKDKTPEEISPDLTPPEIVDVLTATLRTLDRVNKSGDCTGSSLIFDGDRSFRLHFTNEGKSVIQPSTYNLYQGSSVACSFEMKPEKGRWKVKKRGWLMLQAQAHDLGDKPTVWFAKVPGSLQESYIPVRLQIKTNYGTLILHLNSAAGPDGKVIGVSAGKE